MFLLWARFFIDLGDFIKPVNQEWKECGYRIVKESDFKEERF